MKSSVSSISKHQRYRIFLLSITSSSRNQNHRMHIWKANSKSSETQMKSESDFGPILFAKKLVSTLTSLEAKLT